MGFFDRVRDVLTGSDAKRAQKAQELRRRVGLADDPTTAEDAAQADAAKADAAKAGAEKADAAKAGADARQKEADAAEKAEDRTQKKAQQAAEKQADAAEERAEAAERPAAYRTVTVRPGDTLPDIAAQHGVSWQEMARLNNLDNPDLIYAGQVFRVPHA